MDHARVRALARMAVALTALLVAASPASAGVSLGPPATVPTTSRANDVVTADFNGDGRRDLALGVEAPDGVTVLLGDGAGGFTPVAGSPFATAGAPTGLVAADLNGDGKP